MNQHDQRHHDQVSDDVAWSLLYGAAVQQAFMLPQNFQLLSAPAKWDWPKTDPSVASAALYDFCATIPPWSATAAFASSAARYDEAYQKFLNAIDISSSDPPTERQIAAAEAAVHEASAVYDAVFDLAARAYGDRVSRNHPTFTAWLAAAGAPYRLVLGFMRRVMQAAQAVLNPLAAQATLPNVGAAQAALSDAGNFMTITVPSGTQPAPVPGWSASTTPQAWVQQIQSGGGTGATLTVTNAGPAYDYGQTWAQQSAGAPVPFWSVYAGGSWQRIDAFYSDAALSATITIEAIETIQISAGSWYSGTNVFRNGPFVTGCTAFQQSGSPAWMFGAGGIVAAFKTGLVACYQPSVTARVAETTYHRFQSAWPDASGIRIGPFQFGGPSESVPLRWSRSGGGYVHSVASSSQIPDILGVTVAVPPAA